MLTLKDCAELNGLTLDEVDAVACHEGVLDMQAVGRAATLLREPWGDVALRQMIQDNADRARQSGRLAEAEAYLALLRSAAERHPGGVDRRRLPRG